MKSPVHLIGEKGTSLWKLGVFVALILLLRYSRLFEDLSSANLARFVQSFGTLAPLAFIILYAVAAVALVPGSLLTLAGGALFGPLAGTLINLVGATLGATGGFLISRFGGRDFVDRFLKGRVKALDDMGGRNGFQIIFYLRLIPLVPFNALNYAAGLSPIRLKDYVSATAVGMIPGAVAYTYLGDGLGGLVRGELSSRMWIALAVFVMAASLPPILKRILPKPVALQTRPLCETQPNAAPSPIEKLTHG